MHRIRDLTCWKEFSADEKATLPRGDIIARGHLLARKTTSPTTKKGKITDRPEQRRHSPQGLALMAKQGASPSRGNRGDHGYRSPTPPRDDNSPPRYSDESDEEAARCLLSRGKGNGQLR
ncbi:hypothetical protein A2U01_0040175, partial [Trifolium medium]|nr:hypothetical protein [Trifolium medium]